MQRYMYKHGDHPLEGYTIQRAAGRGGFGEVYYALSDSGREVALKSVQNYEQIELRGITQCMNLKSPHLVTIFDVKYNDRGQPFVIMEYVSGPSLRTLLSESPGGLGKQKAAFFLREIAKGLSYLHECGIVHRDLKPGNIFYENGYVKVGDYGLTKAISASRHSGHTITVGTVHYMAPEIGAGKYNFGIDIYALGVLLYEMLTGDVPFAGESPAEILMKHISSQPDLKNIDEPFAHVIKKALAKDPDERYQSVKEMVEDLFGEENIRNSVSQFSPEELSIIAQKVAEKANIDESPKTPSPNKNTTDEKDQLTQNAKNIYEKVDKIGRDIADKVDAKVNTILGTKKTRIPGVTDPIQPAQRHTLAFISVAIVSAGAGFLQSHDGSNVFGTALAVFIMTNVCSSMVLTGRKNWFVNLEPESKWMTNILISGFAAFCTSWIAVIFLKNIKFVDGFLAIFLPMLFIQWHRIALPDRQKRLSLGTAFWAGILGAIAGAIFIGSPIVIAAVLAGTSLFIQAASAFGEEVEAGQKAQQKQPKHKTEFESSTAAGVVPNSLRIFWFVASIVSLGVGLVLVIWGGTQHGEEYAIGVAAGVDGLILSLFFFIGSLRSSFNGWFRYLVKPVLMLICVLTIVASSIYMGSMNLHGFEEKMALFLIIFPSILLLLIISFPSSLIVGKTPQPVLHRVPQAAPGVSVFKRTWALVFSAGGLFWLNGIQRIYVGKIGTGILWFCTFGLFGIGQIIDVILILTGNFKDRYGLPLLIWYDKDKLNNKTSFSQPPVNEYKEPVEEYKEPLHEEPPVLIPEIKEQTTSRAFSSSVIKEEFRPFAYLCSGIGFILAVAGIIVGFGLVLHIPYFVSAGWPSYELAEEMEHIFKYPGWPGLAEKLGTIIFSVLMLLSTAFMIIGRRHLGSMHIIRALVGLLLICCVIMFNLNNLYGARSNIFQNFINARQIGPAFEYLLSHYGVSELLFGSFIFLASIVMLAWPSKKQTLTASQNQGASL